MRVWHVYKNWIGNYRHTHLIDRELAQLGVKVEPELGIYRVISRHRLCRAYNVRSDPTAIAPLMSELIVMHNSHAQVANPKSGRGRIMSFAHTPRRYQ